MTPETFDQVVVEQTKRAPLLAWERLQSGIARVAAWPQVGRLVLNPEGLLIAHCWDDIDLEGTVVETVEAGIAHLREGHARLLERRELAKKIAGLRSSGSVESAVELAKQLATQPFLTFQELVMLSELKVKAKS